jgi:hypothetical protein
MPNSFWVRNGQDEAKISLVTQVAQVGIRGFEPQLRPVERFGKVDAVSINIVQYSVFEYRICVSRCGTVTGTLIQKTRAY